MSDQQAKYIVLKIPCPECGVRISKNNLMKHWRLHLLAEPEGQASTQSHKVSPAQQQKYTPTDPFLAKLTADTAVA